MEKLEALPPDDLLAQTLRSFADAVEATQWDPRRWNQAEQLMLLAQWLCEEARAMP